MSSDPLIKRTLLGETVSSLITREGVISPQVLIRSATPISKDDKIIGAVMTSTLIDSPFVDGIKQTTGLEATIFGDDKISATTLLLPDGKTRTLGLSEVNSKVKQQVLTQGKSYTGSISLSGKPYFAAYLPLKDIDNQPVGMLLVAKEQVDVLQTAARSIELTFLSTIILFLLSFFPTRFIANYLTKQLH